MGARISDLPDHVLCYILSFLPTKFMVATSVLSKRWKPLWRSVPTLDFDGFDDDYHLYSDESNFIQSVNAFLFSPHRHQCLQNLRFCRYKFIVGKPIPSFYQSFVTLVAAAASVQHRFEQVVLSLPYTKTTIPSVMLSCKTLVVFKLMCTDVEAFSSVDLPSLKILHLNHVTFQEYRHLAELLSGCPKLEDMKAIDLYFDKRCVIEPKFKNLSKLISLSMDKDIIPLQVVYNVQFLRIEWNYIEEITPDLTLEFHNLTCVEFHIAGFTNHWLNVFKVLKHCPKLQNLVIHKLDSPTDCDDWTEWRYPLCVPKCISSHLKTCRINNYCGSETDFEFTRYIMQNGRQLHDMAICFHLEITERGRCEMIKKLCFCTRLSSICKLTFSF